jgi:hypothetical protein
MMRYFFCYAGLTFLLLLFARMAVCQVDCTLKKANGDLKVYSCPSKDEKLNKIRTEVILENTTFERFLEFVWDVENYVTWQYNTVEATILKSTGNSMIYRTVVEAPWPLSNREMFTEIVSSYDSIGKKLQIITRSMSYEYPSNDDLVRVPFSEGVWDVSSLGKSSLKVVYTLTIDPGGTVPSWLLNMAIAEGPYQSFTNLKEKLSSKQ